MKYLLLLALLLPFPTYAMDTNVVLERTNTVRQLFQVQTLTRSEVLDKVAEDRLNDMVSNNYFAHVSPKGIGMTHWLSKEKYKYKFAGENLARGYETGEVVNAWIGSPSHFANLKDKDFNEAGIASNGFYTVLILGQSL